MAKNTTIIFGVVCIITSIIASALFFNYNYSSSLNNKDSKIKDLENQIITLNEETNLADIEKNNLQSQVDDLLTDKSLLETQLTTLTSEKQNLQNEISNIELDYQTYQTTHSYSDTQYSDYVSNHMFTNEAYELASFDFYYIKPEQKYGVYDLEDELSTLFWIHDYEETVFDCSEMSAYMEWYLENAGWNCNIVVGDTPFGSGRHAWLLVETSEDAYMPVESTTIEIVWWADPNFDNYFVYESSFETIIEALDYLESDYDWWL